MEKLENLIAAIKRADAVLRSAWIGLRDISSIHPLIESKNIIQVHETQTQNQVHIF